MNHPLHDSNLLLDSFLYEEKDLFMRISCSDYHREFFDLADRPRVKLPSNTDVFVKFIEINPRVIMLKMSYQEKRALGILVCREIVKRLGNHSRLKVNESYHGFLDLLLFSPSLDLTIDYVLLYEKSYCYLNIISVI